jgi:hypothetical protein
MECSALQKRLLAIHGLLIQPGNRMDHETRKQLHDLAIDMEELLTPDLPNEKSAKAR